MIDRFGDHSNLEATDTHQEPVKRLSKKTCLNCNRRDDVLVCSYDGCPIVLHKHCMLCAPHFDDRGNFYCPYCAYKRALKECHKAKEFAILAKKALVNFLDTKVVRSTEDLQTAKSSKGEIAERRDLKFQNNIFGNGLAMELGIPRKPIEIGGTHSGRVGDVNLDSENLKTKRQKTAISSEGDCIQSTKEPHGSAVCSTRNEMMENEDGSDKINSATLQDDFTSSEQLKESSKSGDQFAEIRKDQPDAAKSLDRSPKSAACQRRQLNTSMTHEKFDSGENQATKDTEEVYFEDMEEREKPLVEGSTKLARHDDLPATTKTSINGDVNEFRMTVSPEKLAMKNQQNKDAMDENDAGLAKKVHKQTQRREPQQQQQQQQSLIPKMIWGRLTQRREPTKQNVKVRNKESEAVNFSKTEDEDLSRSHMAVNKNITGQTSGIGDLHCRRVDEEGEQVKLHKDDVISTSKEKRGVPYEEFDTGYESKSSQENHHGFALHSKKKSRITGNSEFSDQPTELGKSSSSSESEFDEYDEFEEDEEVFHMKSRKKVGSLKQMHSKEQFLISISRRKHLPWTTAEEETLKEGVDKFSLTAKKNLPWKKILEFGSHIFDGTRTPADLKNKWRRIVVKALANADRLTTRK